MQLRIAVNHSIKAKTLNWISATGVLMRSEYFLPFFVFSLLFLHLGLGGEVMWADTSDLEDSIAYWDQLIVDCL